MGRPRKRGLDIENEVVTTKEELEQEIAAQNEAEVEAATGIKPQDAPDMPVAGAEPMPILAHKLEKTTLELENEKLRQQIALLKEQSASLEGLLQKKEAVSTLSGGDMDKMTDKELDDLLAGYMKDDTFGSKLFLTVNINDYIDFLGLNKNYIKKNPRTGTIEPRMVGLAVFPDVVCTTSRERIAFDIGFTLNANKRSKLADMLRESDQPYVYVCDGEEEKTTIKEAIRKERIRYLKKRLAGDKAHLEQQVVPIQ